MLVSNLRIRQVIVDNYWTKLSTHNQIGHWPIWLRPWQCHCSLLVSQPWSQWCFERREWEPCAVHRAGWNVPPSMRCRCRELHKIDWLSVILKCDEKQCDMIHQTWKVCHCSQRFQRAGHGSFQIHKRHFFQTSLWIWSEFENSWKSSSLELTSVEEATGTHHQYL